MKLFLKGIDGKIDQRTAVFTTEHKVKEQDRYKNARRKPAEFITSDPVLTEALYRDTGYGKTFLHVDDPEGKRKKASFNVTPLDNKMAALKELYDAEGMVFDGNKPYEVLHEMYRIKVTAKTGTTIKESPAAPIPHKEVDVAQQLEDQAQKARDIYERKYGEPLPDEFKDDKALLSAMADPGFDAKAYIDSQGTVTTQSDDGDALPDDIEELRQLYFQRFNKNVANPKKNDAAWIKAQLTAQAE